MFVSFPKQILKARMVGSVCEPGSWIPHLRGLLICIWIEDDDYDDDDILIFQHFWLWPDGIFAIHVYFDTKLDLLEPIFPHPLQSTDRLYYWISLWKLYLETQPGSRSSGEGFRDGGGIQRMRDLKRFKSESEDEQKIHTSTFRLLIFISSISSFLLSFLLPSRQKKKYYMGKMRLQSM